MEQKFRKHGTRESHQAAFVATISQLPGRPRGGYVGRGCHASVLVTQRSAGKWAMSEAKLQCKNRKQQVHFTQNQIKI